MPKPMNLHARETTDLHADWWSGEKDASGRYVERVVIYAQFLTGDAEKLQSLSLSSADVDWSELARAAQTGDRDAVGDALKGVLAGGDKSTTNLLRVMCVEVTDGDGTQYDPSAEDTYAGMPSADTQFIVDAINALRTAPVAATSMDREIASHNGKSAAAVAQDHFRGRGKAAVSGR